MPTSISQSSDSRPCPKALRTRIQSEVWRSLSTPSQGPSGTSSEQTAQWRAAAVFTCVLLSEDLGSWEPNSCPSGTADRHTLECQQWRQANITMEQSPLQLMISKLSHATHSQPHCPEQESGRRERGGQSQTELIKEPVTGEQAGWQEPCLWCLQSTLPRHRGLHLPP